MSTLARRGGGRYGTVARAAAQYLWRNRRQVAGYARQGISRFQEMWRRRQSSKKSSSSVSQNLKMPIVKTALSTDVCLKLKPMRVVIGSCRQNRQERLINALKYSYSCEGDILSTPGQCAWLEASIFTPQPITEYATDNKVRASSGTNPCIIYGPSSSDISSFATASQSNTSILPSVSSYGPAAEFKVLGGYIDLSIWNTSDLACVTEVFVVRPKTNYNTFNFAKFYNCCNNQASEYPQVDGPATTNLGNTNVLEPDNDFFRLKEISDIFRLLGKRKFELSAGQQATLRIKHSGCTFKNTVLFAGTNSNGSLLSTSISPVINTYNMGEFALVVRTRGCLVYDSTVSASTWAPVRLKMIMVHNMNLKTGLMYKKPALVSKAFTAGTNGFLFPQGTNTGDTILAYNPLTGQEISVAAGVTSNAGAAIPEANA